MGMGGSALAAEVFNDLYQDQQRLHIIRHYNLAQRVSQKDLVIAASFSGNTEETLSAFHQAIERKIPLIAISHDGQLKSICQEKKLAHFPLPDCIQPRYAL
ncbi:MAG: SIS domain-containing protein, partial [Deltaproteobacteria bacterium]|nr:SIS domain-containing protein [Deltaproteobacteria bacterium]